MKRNITGMYISENNEKIVVNLEALNLDNSLLSESFIVIKFEKVKPVVYEVYSFEKKEKKRFSELKKEVETLNAIKKIKDIEDEKIMILLGSVLSIKMNEEGYYERLKEYENIVSRLYVEKEINVA
ncbi:hypothetical protein [Bacillus badius]|uniref:hypothetical protein n=1 Tax=Bacillus badius TaxID=1455 RepID=UPI0007B3C871|nr:hypothetical protein [Bacillus badius]KZR59362.1 hypothetical protein A3781_13250 [Bacillus badius]